MIGNRAAFFSNSKSALNIYLDEISDFPPLTRAEETTLIPAAQAGDQEAFEKVIRANLRFVVTVANEYDGRSLPLSDLISEGNLGLIRALETFDSTRGLRFITYAKWWIRQNIIYALIYRGHLVRVPQSQLRKMNKVRKKMEALESRLNRPVTEQEVVDATGVRQEHVIWSMASYPIRQQSLDAPVREEEKLRLINVIRNEQEPAPDHWSDSESLDQDLRLAFETLEKREVRILALLFGLNGERPATLGEVGNELGVSRERVRQIKNRALEKLRESTKIMNALIDHLA